MGGTRIPASLGETTERPMGAVVWLAVALPILAALSPRDLWDPDEPRYGHVARQMLERDDWLVPRLTGVPYAEKPPLGFWGIAALGAIRGDVTALEARLFPAIFAALATLSLARIVRRWFGDASMGDTAALVFGTTMLVLWDGSRAVLDPLLAATGLWAVEAGTALAVRGSFRGALGFGVAVGAGLLAKGPHAFYAPIGAMVGGCLASGARRRLLDPRWLVGLVLAAALALAWLLPAVEAGGEAYRERLLGQLADRITGDEVPHRHSFVWLLALLPLVALPWTPLALPGLLAALRPARAPAEHRFGLGACLGAIALSLVLLSIPASKREVYLVPVLPFVAALVAYGVHRLASSRAGRWLVPSLAGAAVVTIAAPFLAPAFVPPDRPDVLAPFRQPLVLSAFGAMALLLASGAVAAWRLHGAPAAARAAGIALAAAWLVLALVFLPAFDGVKSHAVAAAIAQREAPGAPFLIAGSSDRSSSWWFRGREVSVELRREPLLRALGRDAPPVLVLSRERHWDENTGGRFPPGSEPRVLARYWVGSTRYVVAVNRP
jgi:hypothetical protein